MKAAGVRHCQVRGCRRLARTTLTASTVDAVVVDTPALSGSAHGMGWRFQVCQEDERRIYASIVDLVTNGAPALPVGL